MGGHAMKLQTRKVLVTGATAGIGQALVEVLLQKGCQVVVCARNEMALDAMRNRHNGLATFRCDLACVSDVERLAEYVRAEHADLAVLINNAGVQHPLDFNSAPYDEIRHACQQEVEVNFVAPVLLSALLLPVLCRQPLGAIVNISTGLALSPKKSSPVYCATKAALRSFTKSLRYQVSEKYPQLRLIEALLPLVDTAMTRGRGTGKISPAQAAAKIIKGVERGRDEIYVGKSSLLRIVHRISPSIADRILKNW